MKIQTYYMLVLADFTVAIYTKVLMVEKLGIEQYQIL